MPLTHSFPSADGTSHRLAPAPGHFQPLRVRESVSLMDLLPTLAELAGDGAAPDLATAVEGRSLVPHLSGSGGHDEVLGESADHRALAEAFQREAAGRWDSAALRTRIVESQRRPFARFSRYPATGACRRTAGCGICRHGPVRSR